MRSLIFAIASVIQVLALAQNMTPIDTIPVVTSETTIEEISNDSVVSASTTISLQRKITPVETDDKKPFKPALHYYDKKGEPLEEPVMFLSELDTIKEESKPKINYPLLNAVSVGINIWDPIMAMAGQKYGGIDIWADLSLYNRFFPVVEMGVGIAENTPKDGNYTYKGKPSFYAKVGMNYNFFFNDTPDYQLFAGVRGGFSSFSYEITDITVNSSYWQQSNNFCILDQTTTALYGEALLGIKVKIFDAFSMGWTFRYHAMFKCNDAQNSTPWYIPGYGSKTSKLTATFSLIYTIPLSKKD